MCALLLGQRPGFWHDTMDSLPRTKCYQPSKYTSCYNYTNNRSDFAVFHIGYTNCLLHSFAGIAMVAEMTAMAIHVSGGSVVRPQHSCVMREFCICVSLEIDG
jgi:hypothetical protein